MASQANSGGSANSTVQSAQNQNNLFDMSGIFSAIIPLVATALIFMIGWAYELIWYSFFGVSTTQLSISIPLILAQSIPVVIIAILIIFLGLFIYICISLLLNGIDVFVPQLLNWLIFTFGGFWVRLITWWAKIRHRPSPTRSNYVFMNFATQVYIAKFEWGIIICIILLTTVLATLGNPYRLILSLMSAVPLAFILIGLLIYSGTIYSILKISRPFIEYTKASRAKVILLGAIYYLLIITMSASMAFSDAAAGKKGILLESVQDVFLAGSKISGIVPDLVKFCNDQKNTCIYGPFGLIAENDNSFFLIKWNVNSQNQTPEFSRDSGLYVVPRSDQGGAFILIPEISLPSPTPTPLPSPTVTSTPQATFTATLMPQPTITLIPTPTP